MSRVSSTMASLRLLTFLLFGSAYTSSNEAGGPASQRKVIIWNESGGDVSLNWISPDGTAMHLQNLVSDVSFSMDSYTGHEFEIREVASEGGSCSASGSKSCRASSFAVTASEKQNIHVYEGLELSTQNRTHKPNNINEVLQSCQKVAMEYLVREEPGNETMEEKYLKCVRSTVTREIERAKEAVFQEASARKKLSNLLENYTCADPDVQTTPNVGVRQWRHNGVTRQVHVKHEHAASRIHVIENFISQEECHAMEEAAAPLLDKGIVSDGKGGSQFSEKRRAMQAAIGVKWNKEAEGDRIARMSRRVYDYTNHVLGLDIKVHGQEPVMSIQYFGRGVNDTAPDRYTPHCDGDCNGLPHKNGTRMATMVMYCTLPKVGGTTNFGNAGVQVVPRKGSAVFFSYIDPATRFMDTGFTEHSGCPVVEGVKKIVTHWIRLGVDEDNPWDSFNSLGIKQTDDDEQ